MDLDEYKIVRQRVTAAYSWKPVTEIAGYMRGRTQSVVDAIKRNLLLEMAFALCFLIGDCFMFMFFADVFYLRLFTLLLIIFCLCFIFYVLKLWRFIQVRYLFDITVKEKLSQYIQIISRFTKLYFQLTIVMIPLILLLALVAAYLDQSRAAGFIDLFSSPVIWLYLCSCISWSVMMYFLTRWYIKKMYGNHLDKLRAMFHELQYEE